jgi:hypothetical protein
MPKFRKRPVIVNAEQWFPGTTVEGVVERANGAHGYIETLEGEYTVDPGDWVITGVAGEKYPCKPEIFAATYDPVNDDTQ